MANISDVFPWVIIKHNPSQGCVVKRKAIDINNMSLRLDADTHYAG